MKTAEIFKDEVMDSIYMNGTKDDGKYILTLEGLTQVANEILKLSDDRIREVIKADRENVAKHAKIDFIPYDQEAWEEPVDSIKRIDIIDYYREEEDEEWGYQQLHDRDGFEIEINRDSIINAPEIELK